MPQKTQKENINRINIEFTKNGLKDLELALKKRRGSPEKKVSFYDKKPPQKNVIVVEASKNRYTATTRKNRSSS